MSFENLPPEQQNKILNAAYEVFAKHGYQKTSMAHVATVAGVSKSVLFKYFSTKENLYQRIFLLASQSIKDADKRALEQSDSSGDLFGLMRQSAQSRLSMFKDYPWVYHFSYTAFFDENPFVQQLVKQESQGSFISDQENRDDLGPSPTPEPSYEGLRKDITQKETRQLIRWVSMGYLEQKLRHGETDPEELEKGYRRWVDIFETLLKEPLARNPSTKKGR